jgi:hypothetical protein
MIVTLGLNIMYSLHRVVLHAHTSVCVCVCVCLWVGGRVGGGCIGGEPKHQLI